MLERLLTQHPAIDVVGEELAPVELLLTVGRLGADLVVVTLPESGEEPGICSHLLSEFPRLSVLALTPHRDQAYLYASGESARPLPGTADPDILEAILTACSAHGRETTDIFN